MEVLGAMGKLFKGAGRIWWSLMIVALLITGMPLLACSKEGKVMKAEKIRRSVIAGSWYPGNPAVLTKEIKTYLSQADSAKVKGRIVALISPHAGYMYSGPVAAHSYKQLVGEDFDTVIIVAPSHRSYFTGASIYNLGSYETPFGLVPLDYKLIESIMKNDDAIHYVPQAHAQEHSLEIQLPFLQVTLKDFKLVPIVMGNQSWENCTKLASAISKAVRAVPGPKKILLVASSDLSHFHTYKEAVKLDSVVVDEVNSFDPKGLFDALSTGKCEACGGGPMITVMLAAKNLGATKAKVLKYANSGDVTGERGSVVGYMAAVLYDNPGKHDPKKKREVGVDLGLSDQDKETLHRIARTVVEKACKGEKIPKFEATSAKLKEPRGAFVTIHKNGQLRGCIGQIRAFKPLYETVAEMAYAAAFEDPRFPPLRADELPYIDIEISVLTPFRKISDTSEIEIGKHGLMIRKNAYSGLLLPQVPVEWNWDLKEFLEHTCLKAGLPGDAWKDKDVEIYVFSAEVF